MASPSPEDGTSSNHQVLRFHRVVHHMSIMKQHFENSQQSHASNSVRSQELKWAVLIQIASLEWGLSTALLGRGGWCCQASNPRPVRGIATTTTRAACRPTGKPTSGQDLEPSRRRSTQGRPEEAGVGGVGAVRPTPPPAVVLDHRTPAK